MVYVGPVPVQCFKIGRRVMQKMSFFFRKAEHDSVLSCISFRENGVKTSFIQRERKEEEKASAV